MAIRILVELSRKYQAYCTGLAFASGTCVGQAICGINWCGYESFLGAIMLNEAMVMPASSGNGEFVFFRGT